MFVPCSAVPSARVGDSIVVRDDEGGERTGTITAMSEGDDEMFFRLALKP
jgi:hypothetical protein